MSDLLNTVIEAHGGLARWNELDTVSARLTQGGVMWAIKGQGDVLNDVFATRSVPRTSAARSPQSALQ